MTPFEILVEDSVYLKKKNEEKKIQQAFNFN